ncbi:hypothetical protein DFH06DRAFT_1141267 [Mycena polygramma]|nr:hypothetical protein DFH06DRAFT_1141267 [Mycena polygramma]
MHSMPAGSFRWLPLAKSISWSFRTARNFFSYLQPLLGQVKVSRHASRATKNFLDNATLTRTSTTTTSLNLLLWMARTSGDCANPLKPSSVAKREAQARYRERNRDELCRKAREGMARRRARLTPDEALQYRITAREDGARYRAENQAMLAQRAFVRRARESIARVGYEAWSAKYRKRHERPIPAVLEAEFGAPPPPNTPEAPFAPSETSEAAVNSPCSSNATFAPRSRAPPRGPRSRLPAPPRDALSRMTESVRKLGNSGLFDVGPPPADLFCLGPPLDLACSGLEGEERPRRRRVGAESSRVRAFKRSHLLRRHLEGGSQHMHRRARAKTHLLVFKICLVARFLAQQARKPTAEALLLACSATGDACLLNAAVTMRHGVAQGAARSVVRRGCGDLRRAGCRRPSGGVEVKSAETLHDVLRTRAILEVQRILVVEVALAAASAAGGARDVLLVRGLGERARPPTPPRRENVAGVLIRRGRVARGEREDLATAAL